jgi:hypothetical protein
MEDVQYIADTLEKPMRRINATRQTDLEQLEIVSSFPPSHPLPSIPPHQSTLHRSSKLIFRLSRLP